MKALVPFLHRNLELLNPFAYLKSYPPVGNVTKLFLSLLVSGKAVHFVSTDNEPFLEV